MNRVEFTRKVDNLIAAMILEGEYPIIDYVKRSPEEQKRLFDAGLSKCDGVKIISAHQVGKAADILFPDVDDRDFDGDTKELLPPKKGWDWWHHDWERRGGKPELLDKKGKPWDRGHFEG